MKEGDEPADNPVKLLACSRSSYRYVMRHILNRFNGRETLIMTSKSIIVLLGNNQQVNDLTIKPPPRATLSHERGEDNHENNAWILSEVENTSSCFSLGTPHPRTHYVARLASQESGLQEPY